MEASVIKNIIRGYYVLLYAHKIKNIEEIDRFLQSCNIPKLNEEEVELAITSKTFKTGIKNLPEERGYGK